jgi:tetratricopeptide (TPR) repeat protein
MSRLPRRLPGALSAAFALSAAALPAAAQQGRPAAAGCEIDQNKPGSLGLAVLSISRVQSTEDTTARNKAVRDAVKRVSDDANAAKQNPVGTAYTLGQAFALLAQDVRLASGGTRADLGFTTNPTAPADLLRLTDSVLTVVEQAKPGCVGQTEQLRQFAWLGTTNAALAALNAQQPDSAARLAERALVVYKKSPLPYYVLATTAQAKGDNARASQYWPRVLEATTGDTAQQSRELRAAALQNTAIIATNIAQSASATDKPARSREAADAIRAFLTAYPTNADAPRMQQLLAAMLSQSGDKTAMRTVYAAQLANPAQYDDLALTNAGVIASQANATEDAAKLFEAALAKNPHQRDGLNNLAATYNQLKRFDAMIPVARRLMAVDPANPDNPLFLAFAYQGLMNAAKTPAQKKIYADSLVKYNTMSQAMPVRVSFSEFTRGESRTVLGMNVEALKPNAAAAASGAAGARRPAAGAAAGAPRTFAFTVEFLDQSGAVVDTQQVSVGPLAPGQSKATRVESAKGGVVAFRYRQA